MVKRFDQPYQITINPIKILYLSSVFWLF